MSVVKLNNDLKELYGKEQEEIQVILARLSVDVAEYIDAIRTDYSVLTELDFIFARGILALDMNASMPLFNTDGRIYIREGRHPLLDKKKVVPITVMLGDAFDLLIITGPNTGGKTVSLKTVGLFTLTSLRWTAPNWPYSMTFMQISGMSRVSSRASAPSLPI